MLSALIQENYTHSANNAIMTDGTDRDPTLAPAEFYAGWYYGLSGDDKRDKVVECYEKNP